MCTTKNEKVSDTATLFLLPISSVLILATFFVCIVGCVAVRCFIPWSTTSEKVLMPALSIYVCRGMPFSLIGPIVFMFITAIMRIKKSSASAVLWFFAVMTGYLFTVLFFCSLAISLYCLLKFGSL